MLKGRTIRYMAMSLQHLTITCWSCGYYSYIEVELQIERYRVSAAEFDGQLNPKNFMEYLVG